MQIRHSVESCDQHKFGAFAAPYSLRAQSAFYNQPAQSAGTSDKNTYWNEGAAKIEIVRIHRISSEIVSNDYARVHRFDTNSTLFFGAFAH